MNPDLPTEVIARILSKLDNVSALLNCRLVSRSWNAECLALLRSSGFRKTVRPDDLEKAAVQFGTHEGQFILPFRLDQILRAELFETEEEFEENCSVEFQKMSQSVVARVFEISGPDSIREYSLSYGPCGAKGLVALTKFLGLIAPRLENFCLVFRLSESLSSRQAARILRKASSPGLLFPNLTGLECSISREGDDYAEEAEVDSNHESIASVLIESSPNLGALYLRAPHYGHSATYWPTSPTVFKTLKTLDMAELRHPLKFLENVRSSQFQPILETFSFSAVSCVQNDEDMMAMTDTLDYFSKTVKSITVALSPGNESSMTASLPLRFPPCLPRLEHLSLTFNEVHYPYFANPQKFNLSQTTFPVLNSVQIPFGCMLAAPPPPTSHDSAQHHSSLLIPSTTFPTVQNLTLLVEMSTFDEHRLLGSAQKAKGKKWVIWEGVGADCPDCACKPVACELHELGVRPEAYMDLVAQIFPSVTHLTVSAEGTHADRTDVEKVIKIVLEAESSLVIEEFEVRGPIGGNGNHLKNILGAPGFVNKFPDLKKIRIKGRIDWADEILDDFACLNALLAQHFPALEKIEMCAELEGGYWWLEKPVRMRKLGGLLATFPAWNVKLI